MFTEGQIVWTCEPSLESSGYDDLPRKPREVKLRYKNSLWFGHSFNHETGEIDTDSNATIFAKETNCFLTKKEANDLFIHLMQRQIERFQNILQHFEENRED